MSIEGKKVHWYRNESEKDHNDPKGTGHIAKVLMLERTMEGLAIIVTEDGSFVTKELQLIKLADPQSFPEQETVINVEQVHERDDLLGGIEAELSDSDIADAAVEDAKDNTNETGNVLDSEATRKLNPTWYNADGTRHTSHPEYDIPF